MLDLNVTLNVQSVWKIYIYLLLYLTNSDLEAAKYPPFRLNYIPEVTFSTINTKPTRQEHYTITLVIAKEQACPVPIPGNKNWIHNSGSRIA